MLPEPFARSDLRNNVTFRHPAEFVGDQDDGGGVLAVTAAGWFVALLGRLPGLEIDPELCQEDWGVVVFAKRNGKRFWIGLSFFDEGVWIAHFHHASTAFLQRFTTSGNEELRKILAEFHDILSKETSVSEINWFTEREMLKPNPQGFESPN